MSPQSIQKKPKAEGENKKGMVYFRSIFLYPYNPQRSFSVWFEYPLHQQSRLFPPFKITRKTEKLSKTFWNDCTVLKKTWNPWFLYKNSNWKPPLGYITCFKINLFFMQKFNLHAPEVDTVANNSYSTEQSKVLCYLLLNSLNALNILMTSY